MLHELKIDPGPFHALITGRKTFELRKDDRPYCVGDILRLRETKYTGIEMRAKARLIYTGREITKTVSHLLRGPEYGISAGWVILSLQEVNNNA